MKQSNYIFQSTQPEWAATKAVKGNAEGRADFNPRSPSGLRPFIGEQYNKPICISIHAARVGCDFIEHKVNVADIEFQSTQPEWAATRANLAKIHAIVISIHAARVGCDSIRINCNYYSFYSYKSAKLTFLLN